MKIKDICDKLELKILVEGDLDREVTGGYLSLGHNTSQ